MHSFLFFRKGSWLSNTPPSVLSLDGGMYCSHGCTCGWALGSRELEKPLWKHLGFHQRVLCMPAMLTPLCPKAGAMCFLLNEGNLRVCSSTSRSCHSVLTFSVRTYYILAATTGRGLLKDLHPSFTWPHSMFWALWGMGHLSGWDRSPVLEQGESLMPSVDEQGMLKSKKRRKLSTWLCWIPNHLEHLVSKIRFFSILESSLGTGPDGRC